MMKSREALIARRQVDPAAPPPEPALPRARNLHPAAQEAAVVYSDALASLEIALGVERREAASLRKQLAEERHTKEYYMNYAAEIKTHLGHIMHAASAAHERALQCAEEPKPQPQPQPDPQPKLYAELQAAVRCLAAESVAPKEPIRETPDLFSPGGGP